KYILGHNPLFPAYAEGGAIDAGNIPIPANSGAGISLPGNERGGPIAGSYLSVPAGIYEIGYSGSGFCFDNELAVHKVYLRDYSIAAAPVTNGEYMAFIESGGYGNFVYWHAEGWEWVKKNSMG